jgi:hypothetical protein
MSEEYARGYREAVAHVARMIRVTDWDPATRRRVRALIRLMASFSPSRPAAYLPPPK